MKLPAAIKPYADRFNALSMRERMLIGITVLVGLYFAVETFLLRPQLARRDTLQQQVDSVASQVQANRTARESLAAKLAQDPNQRQRERLARLQREIERLDKTLENRTVEFISPRQMVEVLRSLVHAESGLDLVRLEVLPAEPLIQAEAAAGKEPAGEAGPADTIAQAAAAEAGETDAEAASGEANVYRHALKLHLRGDYFQALEYVRKLEGQQWRFFFRHLDLRIRDFPETDIRMRLETLSLEEAWIGV